MKKFKFNYYDELEERQKDVLEDKNSAIIYYNYLEDLEDCTLEEKGAMLGALLFYASTHGTEEIPKEYADIIENDRGLKKVFRAWQINEAKATEEWCNHRGSYSRKYTYFEFKDGSKKRIKGNTDNAPKNYNDLWFNDCELREFIEYGNEQKWSRPYNEIAGEWYDMIVGYNKDDSGEPTDKLPF